MSKTHKAYRLKQRIKYTDTEPERIVGNILQELGRMPTGQQVYVVNRRSFRPDFVLRLASPQDILIEVDGPYHNTKTQERKTRWRDRELTDNFPVRIIHVDAELTKNKTYQSYLKDALAEAINSQERVTRIDA